jgi:hypothetical protein
MDRLKAEDGGFKTKNQILMLYNSMCFIGDDRGKIPRSMTEEIGCKMLKLDKSKQGRLIPLWSSRCWQEQTIMWRIWFKANFQVGIILTIILTLDKEGKGNNVDVQNKGTYKLLSKL